MATKHVDITAEAEIHNPKGFAEASNNQGVIKNAAGEIEWVPTSDLGGAEGPPGSVQNIAVSDISSPTELNLLSLSAIGKIVVAAELVPSASDKVTTYYYDSDNSTAENLPYIANTLDGGNTRWVAVNGSFSVNSQLVVNGDRLITTAEVATLAAITEKAYAQYSNSVAAVFTVATDISIDTDQSSSLGSSFTKVNATDIRADFTGKVKVRYSVEADTSGNGNSVDSVITVNATPLAHTARQSSTSYSKDTSSCTVIIDVTTNDIIRLNCTPSGGTATIDIDASLILVERY